MSEEGKPEGISRRKMLSLLGLATAVGLAGPAVMLDASDAEAQTQGSQGGATAPAGGEKEAAEKKTGGERRRARRHHRRERRYERREGRHERRHERREGRHERRHKSKTKSEPKSKQ